MKILGIGSMFVQRNLPGSCVITAITKNTISYRILGNARPYPMTKSLVEKWLADGTIKVTKV